MPMNRRNNTRKKKHSIRSRACKKIYTFHLWCNFSFAYSAPAGIKTQTLAGLAGLPFTLSCRGNKTPNPCRVSTTLYPLSITAIKLNGHTNHIANVFMKPEPQRSVEIAEYISEIAHWHAPLNLTARQSSLIQNASNIQICPNAWRAIKKTLTDASQTAAVCSMLENYNPHWKRDNQMFSQTRFYSQQMTVR